MSRYFKWATILVAVLALALLVVLPTAAAPSGAVTGTIALDKSWATDIGTTLTITVTDADLNVATAITDNPLVVAANNTDGDVTLETAKAGYDGADAGAVPDFDFYVVQGTGVFSNGATSQQVRVSSFPILDNNSDGQVNFLDVGSSIATVTVFSISASEGLVTLTSTVAPGVVADIDLNNDGDVADATDGVSFALTFKAGVVNNTGTTVKVVSTTDVTGCTITLPETGPNTGVFTGTFKTAAATNCAAVPPDLIAGNGATITASYTDASPSATASAAATVETNKPTLSNLVPATGTATSTTVQTLFVDVTDNQSGVLSTTIVFTIGKDDGLPAGTAGNGILEAGEVDATPAVTTTAITGGYRGQVTTGALTEGDYVWSVTANDNAGNTVVLDIDSTVAGSQGQKLKIDTTPSTFNNTGPGGTNLGKTGQYWDPVTKTVKTNKTTSLAVTFSEALDGTTVDKTDFTVAGATPLDAFWTTDSGTNVFLTVVALGPADKPVVGMVGAIKDKAGNSMVPNVTTTIQDGIAPTITAALDKTLVRTTGTVILTIVSNEALGAVPVVTKSSYNEPIDNVDYNADLDKLDTWDENPAGSLASPAAVPAGANQWTWTYAPDVDGSYVVKVSGNDASGNAGAAGVSRCTAPPALNAGACTANADFATKGIVFERDSVVDDPAVSAGGIGLGANPNVYTANPYIVVDFTVEGSEYGIPAAGVVVIKRGVDGIPGTIDDNALVTGTDTHKKAATISKATLDGTAITLSPDTAMVKFIYASSGLALGEHTLVLNYTDEVGNVRGADLSLKFTVKARPSYSIPLQTGMNLISFPATPEKTALKDAFAGTAADLVVTYDPSALAGPWLIAQKGADGNWSGTLASVDNLHGYWVRSTGVAAISVNIPDRGYQDLPPSIPVVAGWNLVPVIDLSGGAAPNFPDAAGTAVAATVAFSGLPGIPTAAANVPFGYTYNTLTGDWTKLLSGANVNIGSAYWVYATAKGTITP